MGIDIYLKSGEKDFSYRLYWITKLIDRYGWQFKGKIPKFKVEKKLDKEEIRQLLIFLEFSLGKLINDKNKAIKKFDTNYFKKAEGINQSIKQLIVLLKKRKVVDQKLLPKLQGLLRRLDSYTDIYGQDPVEQKEEIVEEYDEQISLVKKTTSFLKIILLRGGFVNIG